MGLQHAEVHHWRRNILRPALGLSIEVASRLVPQLGQHFLVAVKLLLAGHASVLGRPSWQRWLVLLELRSVLRLLQEHWLAEVHGVRLSQLRERRLHHVLLRDHLRLAELAGELAELVLAQLHWELLWLDHTSWGSAHEASLVEVVGHSAVLGH